MKMTTSSFNGSYVFNLIISTLLLPTYGCSPTQYAIGEMPIPDFRYPSSGYKLNTTFISQKRKVTPLYRVASSPLDQPKCFTLHPDRPADSYTNRTYLGSIQACCNYYTKTVFPPFTIGRRPRCNYVLMMTPGTVCDIWSVFISKIVKTCFGEKRLCFKGLGKAKCLKKMAQKRVVLSLTILLHR